MNAPLELIERASLDAPPPPPAPAVYADPREAYEREQIASAQSEEAYQANVEAYRG